MSLTVAILAGGMATRLRPLTDRIPKIMIDVGGRPFSEHQGEFLPRNGVRHVVYCVGHLGEQVQVALGDGQRWGMRFDYVFDGPKLLGTGGALRHARALLGEAFFVLYGDSYLPCDFRAVEDRFLRSGKGGLMTLCRNENRWDRSNVEFAGGVIRRYSKKVQTPGMRHIDFGLGVLRTSVLDHYPEGETLDLSSVYQHLLANGDLVGYDVKMRFYEIGSPVGIDELRAYLLSPRASELERASGIPSPQM
jgi:N-acetyl-alpha-D-muramate 1-phosphate uridylyltransferase